MTGRFLTARWVHLAMINYEVDPDVLRGRLPAGTEIDFFAGRTFVSMVGFRFLETRVLGVAVPFHRDFEEVNLRFYVRRETPEGSRRGVVFVKEIVPRRAIAWVARVLYGENYVALPMDHRDEVGRRERPCVEYSWRHAGARCRLAVTAQGDAALPPEGSEERFITEHYWGYSTRRGGDTVEYQVEHPPWRVWSASEAELECDVAGLYGAEFREFLECRPSSAFLAEGSEVVVRKGLPLKSA